ATDGETVGFDGMALARQVRRHVLGDAAVVRHLHGFDVAVADDGDAYGAGFVWDRIVADAGIPALRVDGIRGGDLVAHTPDPGLMRGIADEIVGERVGRHVARLE